MSNYKTRLHEESLDIEVKIDKLIDFMHRDVYPTLTPTDQGLLMVQLTQMKSYASTLRNRLERLN